MKKVKKLKRKVQAPLRRNYIQSVYLDNYKSFRDNAKIDLAPMVNLIFGQNSAGKSSIFQALRLFRQSYSPGGNMSVLNYEAPAEYRGRGGLDIDIGYKGIVNESNKKKQISLGVNIGSFNKIKNEFTNEGELKFKFKYISNFYKGKNLIKNKTIPSNITFSDSKNFVSIDLIKHKFFKENDDRFKSMITSAPSFRRYRRRVRVSKTETAPYGSIYDPFFFLAKVNKNETKLKSIDLVYDAFEKVRITDIYEILIEVIKRITSEIKKSKKNEPLLGYAQRRERTKDVRKKMLNEIFSSQLGPQQRVDWILKNIKDTKKENKDSKDNKKFDKGDAIDLFNEEFGDKIVFSDSKTKIRFAKRIGNLVKFLKKKNINKKVFYDYFLNDIIEENKDLIFFNGEFLSNPTKTKLPDFYYFANQSEDSSNYLVNIFGWLLLRSRAKLDFNEQVVNLIGIFDSSNTATVTSDAMYGVDTSMKKMIVVPGLRSMPKRYFVKGMQTNYVGSQGENLAELLANPKIQKEANKWLHKLEIPYKVNIQSSGNYYEIVFKPNKSNINIAQTHIGLGYPLVLPLIVQSLISRNKIIIVEEPEVHLHPKIEADLAELIVHSSINFNNQFLIETHSEEFLLRVLKNVRDNKIKPENISINYITNDRAKGKNTGSIVNKIKINKFGQYQTPWKDDLFAERRKEFK